MKRLEHTIGEHHGFVRTIGLGVEHYEFVTSDATNNAMGWQDEPQPCGHCNEYVVAGCMPEAVVDVLESIDVNEQHGWLAVVAPCRAQSGVDVLQHQAAIGQAGECVGLRTFDEFGLQLGVGAHGNDHAQQHDTRQEQHRHSAHDSIASVLGIG